MNTNNIVDNFFENLKRLIDEGQLQEGKHYIISQPQVVTVQDNRTDLRDVDVSGINVLQLNWRRIVWFFYNPEKDSSYDGNYKKRNQEIFNVQQQIKQDLMQFDSYIGEGYRTKFEWKEVLKRHTKLDGTVDVTERDESECNESLMFNCNLLGINL